MDKYTIRNQEGRGQRHRGGAGANDSGGKGEGAMQARINQEGDKATQLMIFIGDR